MLGSRALASGTERSRAEGFHARGSTVGMLCAPVVGACHVPSCHCRRRCISLLSPGRDFRDFSVISCAVSLSLSRIFISAEFLARDVSDRALSVQVHRGAMNRRRSLRERVRTTSHGWIKSWRMMTREDEEQRQVSAGRHSRSCAE